MSKHPAGRHKETGRESGREARRGVARVGVRPVRHVAAAVRPVRRRTGTVTRTVTAGAAAALVIAVAIVVNGAQGGTTLLEVPAQADTFVSSSHRSTAYDTAPSLWISDRSSNRRTAYLQFVVPSGKRVRKAELVLTRDAHHFPSTSVTVSRAEAAWPGVVRFTNRPDVGAALATAEVHSEVKTVVFDVSRAVTGPGVVAFALTTPVSDNAVRFLSRDSGSAAAPRLRLALGDAPVARPPAPGPSASVVDPGPGRPSKAPEPSVSTTTGSTRTVPAPAPTPTGKGGCPVSRILVPSCGVWFGAAPSTHTDVPRDVALADFERRMGTGVDIAHTYHVDGQLFPNDVERRWVSDPARPRMLLVNWKPMFGHSWAQVARGEADAQIDKQAKYLTSTFAKQRFFLAIFHEPENDVRPAAGSGWTASDYRAMYRHVALRLRARGVDNAVLVMNFMGAPKWGPAPWFGDLYPGDDVVDWVAYDPYATAYPGFHDGNFSDLVNRAPSATWPGMYAYLTKHHPGKPIMLAEWGVADDASSPGVKPDFFRKVPAGLDRYPAIKAMVYFDSPNATFGDTRTNSTARSQAAFNEMVSDRVFTRSAVP